MIDLDARAAEDAELIALRAQLISDNRKIAALEARRIRREARVFDIARTRMEQQRSSTKQQEMELRSIALELGAPLRIHDRTMQNRLNDAGSLVERFAATVDALEQGRISIQHVEVIHAAGIVINDPEKRAEFESDVLRFAEAETPSRTRAYAQQQAELANPRTINERFSDAMQRRQVTVTELEDGMAKLCAILPAASAFGMHDRLTRMGKALKKNDDLLRREHAEALARGDIERGSEADLAGRAEFDDRRLDHVRADLIGATVLTGTPTVDTYHESLAAIKAIVQLTIPVSSVTGVTSGGGELDGRSAVDDETARILAGNAPGWDRVFTDPVTGTVYEVDRYNPLECQRRFLNARDGRCRTPGCRGHARNSQIDHNHERHEGGRTHLGNLCGFCLRHHTLKTESVWTAKQGPGGSLLWTSPLGFTYRDDPPRRVVFVPSNEPAPF